MICAMKCTTALLILVPAISALGSCSDKQGTDPLPPANTQAPAVATAANADAQAGAANQVKEPWPTEFQALATGENALDALAVFESLKTDQPELLTSENLLKMTVFAIEVAKSIELTQPILDYAMANYPKEIGKFGGIDAAIFRLQNPNVADLPLDGAHAPIEGNTDAGAEAEALIKSAAGLGASGTEEG
jgi:hypothetical protein